MKYLLDTDTCVFALRGRGEVKDHIAPVGLNQIAISIITLAELRYGASCSTRPEANHQAIDDFVSALAVLGVDVQVARAFGDIKTQLRQAGELIEDLDVLIAATARAYDLTLVTNNTAHFGRISGLRLENWIA